MYRFKIVLLILPLLTLSHLAFGHGQHDQGAENTQPQSGTQFGQPLPKGMSAQPLVKLMAEFKKSEKKTVVLEAEAKKVCQKKGCWMVLKDGDAEVRTLFKDYGFFVPKDLMGKQVRVFGTLQEKTLSAATQRHYLKDEGASPEEVAEVKEEKREFQFVAEGVEILDNNSSNI